jgi:transmembrane sensor
MNTSNEDIRIAIAEQAAEWFVTNQSGPLDSRSCEEFNAWLRSSPIHVAEYLAVAGIARDLPAAAASGKESITALVAAAGVAGARQPQTVKTGSGRRLSQWLEPLSNSRLMPRAVVAAALVCVATGIGLWKTGAISWNQPQSYHTLHGEQQAWQLPDGSSMQLNTDSTVNLHYTRTERVLEVVSGQAFFQVKQQASRRFRVEVAGASVIAVGTKFDIDRRGESAIVTLVEGQVAVVAAGVAVAQAGAPQTNAVFMSEGQQLTLNAGTVVSLTNGSNVAAVTAWLNRQIIFERRPLGEVAAEFSRYTNTRIEIVDPVARSLQISGIFNAYDSDSFISFLESMDTLTVQRNAGVIRVSGARP